MSILKNLKKMHAAVIAQRTTQDESQLGQALNNAAVKAVIGGIKSDEWKSYMAIFADNPAQLERLTVPKTNEPGYVNQFRAYIVSNAICAIDTNGATGNRVTAQVDGVAGTADPPVPDIPNDPNGEIKNLRPDGLKSIPDVTV